MEDALRILVKHATGEFGFTPRDVHRAIFNPFRTKQIHAAAIEDLDHPTMATFAMNFLKQYNPDVLSHRVIAVRPIPACNLNANDRWAIDFKSPQIAKNVVERLQQEEIGTLREMFYLFKRIPNGHSSAGRLFEAMVHRESLDGWQQLDGPTPLYKSPTPAPLSASGMLSIRSDFQLR